MTKTSDTSKKTSGKSSEKVQKYKSTVVQKGSPMTMEELLQSTGYKQSLRSSSSVSLKTAGLKIPSQKKSSVKMTMEELLVSTGYRIPSLKRGQEVKGKILTATRSEILVDIGAKSEGIVYGREIAANPDLLLSLAPGDPIEATVIYPENEQGQVVLSLRKHSGGRRWTDLDDKKDTGEAIEVVAAEVNRGGIICEYFGVRGFLPASQLSPSTHSTGSVQAGSGQLASPSKMGDLIGKRLTVSVIEADQATNRLIFSQKAQRDLDAVRKVLANVKIGAKYKGVVTAILPFGVFVEIGVESKGSRGGKEGKGEEAKIEGLVHLSEISWEKLEDPTKDFSVGQELDVIVISKDEESGRLNLSIKQLSVDPFLEASKEYAKSQKVTGKVSKVTPYGVFVTLPSGLDGLVHISKIPPSLGLLVGDKIECEVESVDAATRRIALVPIATEKPVLYR